LRQTLHHRTDTSGAFDARRSLQTGVINGISAHEMNWVPWAPTMDVARSAPIAEGRQLMSHRIPAGTRSRSKPSVSSCDRFQRMT
jgi:hypothetical protein